MSQLFLICAVLGGTVFVFQFVMSLIGIGAEDVDFADDVPDDVPDDLPDDLPDEVPDEITDAHGSVVDHDTGSMFAILSIRTIVAALTFFGLAGMATLSAGAAAPVALIVALVVGYGAMLGVYYLMRALYGIRHDGTVRIQRAIGRTGTVYVPIPANDGGMGKVQLRVQNRIMEFKAVTDESEKLATGKKVVVTDVVDPSTVRVSPVNETVA